jgi:O-antigen/teichoic acid export membrane protein
MRLDLFIVSFFSGVLTTITKNDVGYYGLAQRIVLVVVTLIISITQVLSPSFAAVKSRKQAVHELWHGLLYIMMPVTVFIALAITPGWVFDFFFTKDFTQAARYAHILSLPYILFSISNIPMLFLLYTVKKPKYILIAHVTFFVINAAGCYLLIPQFGVIGAPYAVGIGFTIAIFLLGLPAYNEVQKLPKKIKKEKYEVRAKNPEI